MIPRMPLDLPKRVKDWWALASWHLTELLPSRLRHEGLSIFAARHIFFARYGSTVISGPFRGMKLRLPPYEREWLFAYLLGTQELELREAIESAARTAYRTIINIGAAEGYYVLGLAIRSRPANLIAYEANKNYHGFIAASAKMNGIGSRLSLRGHCDPIDLARDLAAAEAPVFLLIDIEGGELAMLDPLKIPELTAVDILVETHDGYAPGCTRTLIERFSPTHAIRHYRPRPRTPADFPPGLLKSVLRRSPGTAVGLLNERRGRTEWLHMTAKRHA